MPDDFHEADIAILAAMEREGRVTPGYLQGVLGNHSPYVRQRLRALVRMGYIRDLGHALYERMAGRAGLPGAPAASGLSRESGPGTAPDMPEAWWRNWRGLSPTGRLAAALAPVDEFVAQMRKRGLPDSRVRKILRNSW